MKILYIFPHPDDESFGPGPGIARQVRDGHEVALLTLTRGGATKMRHRLGLSVEEMGDVRFKEMLNVAREYDLAQMTVLDLPDSGLKEMDPRDIEMVITSYIHRVEPEIIITYPVHGISGFHDHLVCHHAVKRVFMEQKEEMACLKRLAFFTLPAEQAASHGGMHHLNGSAPPEIDCVMSVTDEDIAVGKAALDCYETYRETVEKSGIKKMLGPVHYEIFREYYAPPLADLSVGL